MSQVRRQPEGDSAVEVLASEIGRLRRQVAELERGVRVRGRFEPVGAREAASAALDDATDGLPRGVLARVETSNNQSGISAEVQLNLMEATVDAGVGRRLQVAAQVTAQASSAGMQGVLRIKENGSTVAETYVRNETSGASGRVTVQAHRIVHPASGERTYTAHFERTSGSGDYTASAASWRPTFLYITDVGGQ